MSPAPRFSTADIAKGAQQRENERIEQERQAEQAREAERAERDRETAPHIAGSEPMKTSTTPITAANPITAPGPAMPVSNEPDAAAARAETRTEKRAERKADAAVARATAVTTSTDRQLAEDSAAPLFATDAATGFQQRWDHIQAGFVDDPRHAVEEADALVAETMQRLAETFAEERRRLEQELARRPQGANAESSTSTEDLRIALRHYRSFFKRLLSV